MQAEVECQMAEFLFGRMAPYDTVHYQMRKTHSGMNSGMNSGMCNAWTELIGGNFTRLNFQLKAPSKLG